MSKVNIDQVILLDQVSGDALKIMESKNKDYRGGSNDVYANFRQAVILGLPEETGLLIRMLDKHQRIRSFIHNGTLAVQGESIRDAIIDCVNYTILLAGMLYAEPGYSRLLALRDYIISEARYRLNHSYTHHDVDNLLQNAEDWMIARQYNDEPVAFVGMIVYYIHIYKRILEGRE